MFRLKKEEVRALVASSLLLCVGVGLAFVFSKYDKAEEPLELTVEDRKSVEKLHHKMTADSLAYVRLHHNVPSNAEPFPFDPNHADSATLCRVGLRTWQVRNLLKYRRKGGKWRSTDDFKRLYGLSEQEFERLRPYIRISPEDADDTKNQYKSSEREEILSELPVYEKIEKYDEGTTIDLNLADTTALKHIPGIGSYYSQKIIRYRERLGGFVRVSQIEELEGLPPGMTRWFTLASSEPFKKIRINHSTFKDLVRHPYLSYEQTKVIVNHIRKYGPLYSWKDLSLYREFTEEDFERLKPYIVFD